MDDLPFTPESCVTINGNAYVVRLLTKLKSPDGEPLYRYISVDMSNGQTLDGFDYTGPIDL